MSISILTKKQAAGLATSSSDLFVRIPNPSDVYPSWEVCPIAPALTRFGKNPVAAVMDMDGTTTTTETLCLHSLEYAIRQAMGTSGSGWTGLDPDRDYPNVIGNSTTKHVEYLVDVYGDRFDTRSLGESFLEAAAWTLCHSRDEQRRQQVRINLRQCETKASHRTTEEATGSAGPRIERRELQVQACIDIYYRRYHEILAAIEADDRGFLDQIPGVDAGRPLIEPMPGVAVTLALLSGDLGDEAAALADLLPVPESLKNNDAADRNDAANRNDAADRDAAKAIDSDNEPAVRAEIMTHLGRFFQKHPVRLALVTSSIRYEAEVVMGEVFHVIRQDVAGWPVSDEVKARLMKRFASPEECYDAFVTASDSSEIRLKPFRDLYSIALHQSGVHPDDFDAVIGFEDSQSGTVAIRAAGIGRCIALPFHETGGHAFDAASVVAHGGLPEVLIRHRFFLDKLL